MKYIPTHPTQSLLEEKRNIEVIFEGRMFNGKPIIKDGLMVWEEGGINLYTDGLRFHVTDLNEYYLETPENRTYLKSTFQK